MQLMSLFRSSPRSCSNYSRRFDLPEAETSEHVGGAMLPIFFQNNLQNTNNYERDLVEVTLQLDKNSFVLCSVDHKIQIEEENSPPYWLRSPPEKEMILKAVRNKSSAERALGGLRFISKTSGECDSNNNDIWGKVESRFNALAKNGLLRREDFGECIGTVVSTGA